MKKITLAVIAAFSSFSMAYSQANIAIEAPFHNANYIDLLPSGAASEATLNAIYLYTPSDLSALTSNSLTSIGIQYNRGTTGTAVSGTFTLYLKNTSDVAYTAGASFTSAIQSMTVAYTGTLNIPTGTAASTVNIPVSSAFSYTGGGLYVGFDFRSTGPFVTPNATSSNLAAYPASTVTGSSPMGGIEQVAATGTITDVLDGLGARPCLSFKGVNTAANEVEVTYLSAMGKVATSLNTPQVVKAMVKNHSTGPLSNVTVSLSVSGANTFATTQTIPSLAVDGTATVSFTGFNPQTQGVNNLTVTVPNDNNNNNNRLTWTQSVTCNVMGNNPPETIASFDGGVGAVNEGIFATKFTTGTNAATLTAIRIAISSDADNIGTYVYGVIADDQGAVFGTTDSVKISTSTNNSFVTFKFTAGAQVMAPNSSYFIGLAQPSGGSFPMAYREGTNIPQDAFVFTPSVGGGAFSATDFGYFGIEPVLGPEVIILGSATPMLCLGDQLDLMSTENATTYSWSAVPGSTVNGITTNSVASISVVPTKTGTIVYTLKGTDAAGCSNTATVSAKISACVGIPSNTMIDANIKLYPNPAVDGKSTISGLEGANTITVYNILGQSVITKKTTESNTTIDLSSQPTGNYMIRIVDSNNHSKTMKVIHQN